jgi:RimJ/RimL family protein N-acetyltransferase
VPDDRLITAPGDSRAWSALPPVLRGTGLSLREAERGDALALFSVLSHPQVASALTSVPNSPADLANLIEAAVLDRCNSRGLWLVVVPDGASVAGMVRVREIEAGFRSADWEFALAYEQWGSGLFPRAASMAIDFVFGVLKASRLEARVAVPNVRAEAVLRRLGACQEAVLRQSMRFEGGICHDQLLLTLFADDWRAGRGVIRKIH